MQNPRIHPPGVAPLGDASAAVGGFAEAQHELADLLTRVDASSEDITRRFLMRAIADGRLEDVARLPIDRIARELPELVKDLMRDVRLASAGSEPPPAPSERAVSRLASLRAGDHADPAELVRDTALLQSTIIEMLGDELGDEHPGAVLHATDLLTRSIGAVLAAAVSELVTVRSRELEAIANTDPLTGLRNLRYLRSQLTYLIGLQQRYAHPFGLLIIDLNGLKRINDAFGHAIGDRALIAVAEALQARTRTVDTTARMGGDEFCVLAPDQTAARARILADRISDAIERLERPEGTPLSVAVGVVSCPEHGIDPETLLEAADQAMYRSKATGSRVAVGDVERGLEAQPS